MSGMATTVSSVRRRSGKAVARRSFNHTEAFAPAGKDSSVMLCRIRSPGLWNRNPKRSMWSQRGRRSLVGANQRRGSETRCQPACESSTLRPKPARPSSSHACRVSQSGPRPALCLFGGSVDPEAQLVGAAPIGPDPSDWPSGRERECVTMAAGTPSLVLLASILGVRAVATGAKWDRKSRKVRQQRVLSPLCASFAESLPSQPCDAVSVPAGGPAAAVGLSLR